MTTERTKASIPIYTVDAFSTESFRGNPAAVCLLPRELTFQDKTLQAVAAEMNLSDTAFVELLTDDGSFKNDSSFKLRWFTPTSEVPLCGHGTLASAAVLFFACENVSSAIQFDTVSGTLMARRNGDMITLDFPLNETQTIDRDQVQNLLKELCESSLIEDVEYSATTKNLLVRLMDNMTRKEFENLKVDTKALQESEQTGKIKGVIMTLKGSEANKCTDAKGNVYDFVSRYFVPWVGVAEDPVTGSAHTLLAGYWKKHLEKSQFYAYQCSKRGGEILCSVNGDRVELTEKLSTETLQTIAAEINLTETAYVEHLTQESTFDKGNKFNLRWFTPTDEIELCGHATLASAAVLIFGCGNTSSEITFNSMGGTLTAKRNGDMITLDFPLNPSHNMERSDVESLVKALCSEELIKDVEYSPTTKKLLVCVHDGMSRSEFEGIVPDYQALEESDKTGRILEVIFTMKGSENFKDKDGREYDFVSRNFSPWVGIPEDPVTGSAHTVLADYWRRQLGTSKFYARQCSARGGEMTVKIQSEDRVELSGKAQIVIKGELFI